MSGTAALNGAGAGASTGAAIGSVIPGVGTAIGGAVGAVVGGVAGLLKKKKKSAVKKSNEQAKIALNKGALNVMDRGQALADRKYTSYDPRQRVAGLSDNERSAMTMAGGLAGKYDPLFQRASEGYSAGALDRYKNPYIDSVINSRARRINEDYDSRLGALNRKRSMVDAWGGSRGTQLELGLQKQRSDSMRDMEAEGYSTAFDKANEAFFRDRGDAAAAVQAGASVDRGNIDALMGTGGVERGLRQSTTDFDYQQFLEGRDWDLNNFGALLESMKTAGSAINAGEPGASTPKASTGGQLAGLASTVAGLWGKFKGGGSATGGSDAGEVAAGKEIGIWG
jgi:hypothetical protein